MYEFNKKKKNSIFCSHLFQVYFQVKVCLLGVFFLSYVGVWYGGARCLLVDNMVLLPCAGLLFVCRRIIGSALKHSKMKNVTVQSSCFTSHIILYIPSLPVLLPPQMPDQDSTDSVTQGVNAGARPAQEVSVYTLYVKWYDVYFYSPTSFFFLFSSFSFYKTSVCLLLLLCALALRCVLSLGSSLLSNLNLCLPSFSVLPAPPLSSFSFFRRRRRHPSTNRCLKIPSRQKQNSESLFSEKLISGHRDESLCFEMIWDRTPSSQMLMVLRATPRL